MTQITITATTRLRCACGWVSTSGYLITHTPWAPTRTLEASLDNEALTEWIEHRNNHQPGLHRHTWRLLPLPQPPT